MESSGPEGGKVRGPAAMIHERYLQLARDAASSGDRVLSENFLQHAEHYFRLWRSTQPATPPPQQVSDRFDDGPEGDEDVGGDAEAGEESEVAADSGEQPDGDFAQGERQQQFERDGERRRGRGRRGRYRPSEGEGGGEGREARSEGERESGGEARDERPPRERRERQPREQREETGPEGFSSGPKPAFLRD